MNTQKRIIRNCSVQWKERFSLVLLILFISISSFAQEESAQRNDFAIAVANNGNLFTVNESLAESSFANIQSLRGFKPMFSTVSALHHQSVSSTMMGNRDPEGSFDQLEPKLYLQDMAPYTRDLSLHNEHKCIRNIVDIGVYVGALTLLSHMERNATSLSRSRRLTQKIISWPESVDYHQEYSYR